MSKSNPGQFQRAQQTIGEPATPARQPSVDLPWPTHMPEPKGYATRHVELQMTLRQARAIRRYRDGLVDDHVTLDTGKPISSAADVFRFFADVVASRAEEIQQHKIR